MSGGVIRSTVTAVLGPTNTGKTHLAVERMCAHASGMIGFPLRLLAREVYERVVRLKGEAQVALITGEEKILPPNARYFLCTAESMPADRPVAFVAIDEGQMGADPERGHVFTDRLLHARGTAETMILGSATLRPLLRRLLPDAEIVTRPRFSTLSFGGSKKLSRLPRRSAIVAFTADEVYALAEMLRRHKGGAAVVMGGLSPRTRNAQVEMFQSGEVDHLVATDAIGMGLNMDIANVAFASLSKFDGRRTRRLSTAELAQIAGRAGRHRRDGTFGTVQLGQAAVDGLEPEEIAAIENHAFPPLTQLVWRNTRLDFDSLAGLVASLDRRPTSEALVRAADAIDLAVLKLLAGENWVEERARSYARLRRLWDACGLPDYRKTGAEMHARLVARVYRHLTEGNGHIPPDWIAAEVANLDNVEGDIAAVAGRIAAARTWTYVAHRPAWLEDQEHWAGRTRALEDKLSDALHQKLTQRFVDRRTAVLLKDLQVRSGDLATVVEPDGEVSVEGEPIGRLEGFRFVADPAARAGEKRLLLAAAERRLGTELSRRSAALVGSDEAAFELLFDGGMPPRIVWNGTAVASLAPGRDALHPKIVLDRSLDALATAERTAVRERLERWFETARDAELAPLVALAKASAPGRVGEGALSPAARGFVVQLVETLGCMPRARVAPQLAALDPADRQRLRQGKVRLGSIHVYLRELLRPQPTRWRLALWAVARGMASLPALPPASHVTVLVDPAAPAGFYDVAGFWRVGAHAFRIDMVDRLAAAMHDQRDGRAPFAPDASWASTLGVGGDGFSRLMRALGYRRSAGPQAGAAGGAGTTGRYEWRGPPRERPDAPAPGALHSPFAVLAHMKVGGL